MKTSVPLILTAVFAVAVVAVTRADEIEDSMAEALAAYDAGNYPVALEIWRKSAAEDDTEAMTAIANLYLQGEGVGANATRAVAWYRRAAKLGDVVAQMNLGDLMARGIGTSRDPIRAYVWLGLAASAGNAWSRDRQAEVAAELSAEEIATAKKDIAAWRSLGGD